MKLTSLVSSLTALASICSAAATTKAVPASVTFDNNRRFLFDTDGRQIDAYGAKINNFNGKYYLYGNSFSETGVAYGIKSYSSVDLVSWQYEGFLFDPSGKNNPCAGSGGCGRPHIVFNANTKTYVLWANAGAPGYAVATSKAPTGPFVFEAHRALIDPAFDNLNPADFSVEVINGEGFIVFSALNFRDPRAGDVWPPIFQNMHVSKLTADFMNTTRQSWPVVSSANDLIDNEAESPEIFKVGSTYYVAASNTCGYCNGSIALLYRSNSIQGPWTRQILEGYSCNGQLEGVLPLTNPTTGNVTNIWHSTTVPGGPRTGFSGHTFQPLIFNTDGSAKNLDCSSTATFPVEFTKGNGSVAAGNATKAGDATPALAVYSPVCDSDSFILYQTWTASKSGTIKSVSVNVARGVQTVPLSLTVFKLSSINDLFTPEYKWTPLGSSSCFANQTSYTFDTVTVPLINATVSQGELLGFRLQGADYSPWCHLEFDTKEEACAGNFRLFQQGQGQYSWRGLQGKNSPVYERQGKSVKFFATYA
ncbi:Arabinanase/levansucrase/invertase [Aureobasidium melanogenum CBS 110374]|uniref:Arabinanase/levansucrase/invertase n=1 Tax=Aureobasidium melanogenum (strain CBS 110374) TaxID=1043003 RepID=A0A074W052_AURM1|nr:Arabinanase/levansucrase/invertase [Aureobasidium melanogenum CBS 110374]KEQ66123.1 Arabinanase/levansucrase/invertase [Aureobasidium melanogenum CBS 110374]